MLDERVRNKRHVSVHDLVPGLYVAELDRPWTETPFLFQGFKLDGKDEIAQIQRYCRFVYVDPDRSDRNALRRLSRASRGNDAHEDIENAFGTGAYPDDSRFIRLARKARKVRSRSRKVIDSVFRDVRLGHSVDTEGARHLIRDMVGTISENASASLWLTNLKNRDEYTSIHCMNVCVLAIAFGRHVGLEEQALETLGLGALLHDIGKLRTPDEVLLKPGKLTAAEYDIMKRHPAEGYEIMRATGRIPDEALDIIRHHHERISGHGYPDGLAGDQIPLPVTITALADVYDALTSDRVYRPGMPADKALQIMFENAASDFGQDLMEEFIRCLGIYPVGSVVELDTGALGVVITSGRDARLRPVVMMVRTPAGDRYEKRLVVNLAALAESGQDAAVVVRRVVKPDDYDIDVAAILASALDRR